MKKFNIFLLTAFLLVAIVFALSASGHESEYIKNYTKNFKTNLYVLSVKLGLPQEFTEAVPTPEPPPIYSPTPEPTTTPAPPFASQHKSAVLSMDNSYIVPVQNSANMVYAAVDGKLFAVDKTTVNIFDKKGSIAYTQSVQLSNPLVRANGSYAVAADKGGNRIYLFNGDKLEFSADTESSIVSVDVSENGDVVLVCDKDFYKGSVVVYNKRGEVVYAWNSGSDRVLDADISGQSRKVAVVTMNIDNDAITSNILWCDIDKEATDIAAQYTGSLMYDAEFIGNDLVVVGDDRIAGINSRGKPDWETVPDSADLKRYDVDGYFAGAFDIDNMPHIRTVTSGGKEKGNLKINIQPDYLDIMGSAIAYNDERTLVFSDFEGEKTKSFSCMRDISDIIIVDNSTVAVVYSSSIEFVNVK